MRRLLGQLFSRRPISPGHNLSILAKRRVGTCSAKFGMVVVPPTEFVFLEVASGMVNSRVLAVGKWNVAI